MVDVVCPQCEKKFFIAAAVDPTAVAHCPACGAVSSAHRSKRETLDERTRPVLDKPDGIECEDSGHSLTIWWSWRHIGLILIFVLWVIWSAFFLLMSFFSVVLLWGKGMPEIIGVGVFVVGGMALNFGLGYALMLGLLNSTTVELNSGMITVRHGPLPWLATVEVPASRVKQLYVRIKVGGPNISWRLQQAHDTFDLVTLLHDDTRQTLIAGHPNREELRFIEQQLEKRLGIQDQRLPDEYLD